MARDAEVSSGVVHFTADDAGALWDAVVVNVGDLRGGHDEVV